MRVFQLVLTEQQVDVIFGALGMIQYNQSVGAIEAIKAQVKNQIEAKDTSEAKATPDAAKAAVKKPAAKKGAKNAK